MPADPPEPAAGPPLAAPRRGRRPWAWALFAAAVAFVPVPFYLIVVGGLVPLGLLLAWTASGLATTLTKLTGEAFVMLGILLAHLIVFGAPVWLASVLATRALFRFLPPLAARAGVALLIVALAAASLFPIYRIPGHNSAPAADALRIYGEIFP